MTLGRNYGALKNSDDEQNHVKKEVLENVSDTEIDSEETESLLGHPRDIATQSYKLRNTVLGVTFSLLSGACFTGSNFLIKEFGAAVSDVVLVRCVIQITVLTSFIVWKGEKLLPVETCERYLTLAQGLTGSINFITGMAYVSFMPVADGLTLVFCSPAVTILLSAVVLGHRLTPARVVSGLCLVTGALLVCQPPVIFGADPGTDHGGAQYLIGVCLASTSCLSGGLTNVLISKAQGVPVPVLVDWVAICGMSISIIYSLLSPGARILTPFILSISITDWLVLVFSALGGLAAFALLTKALHLISPSLVASLRSLMLVVAFCMQTLLTGQLPNVWDWLGAGLVVGGVVLLSL